MPTSHMRRQVLLLSSAQALFQTAAVLLMTVGALAGALVAPTPALATVPIAASFLGTAIATIPASVWMARVGRRTGFVTGAASGVAAGLVAALALAMQSLALLAAGTFLLGVAQAFAQFYRFAAGEVADDAYRPRAISLVLAGGVVAAIAGPLLGRWGGPLLPTAYLGSFLLLSLACLLAGLVLSRLDIPAPAAAAAGGGRPLARILAQPAYLVAMFGAATGYGVMILAMTATPLAMGQHHHSLGDTATVIQLHVLGMFVPSFFTGSLIARFGVLKVMLAGVALLAGHVLASLAGTSFHAFAGALVLLGVGWNFLFIGGTTLLTTTYTPAEKGRAQAMNDLTIVVIGVACSAAAAPLLHALGWEKMNLVLLPWLGAAGLALAGFGLARARAAAT